MEILKKRWPLILLLVCVVAMGVWAKILADERDHLNAEIANLRQNLNKEKQEDKALKEKIQANEAELQKIKDFFNQKANSEQKSLEDIKRQYANEYEKLMQLKQQRDDLKNSSAKGSVAGVKDQIKVNQDLIASLENQLKEFNAGEKDVNNEEKTAVKNKDLEAKEAQNTLNVQIRQTEAVIKDTRSQITFWRKRNSDINQAAKLKDYETTLAEQTQLLQSLQSKKLEVSADARTASGYIKNRASAEKEDLKDNEAQIRDRISRAKAEVKRLQDQTHGIDKENEAVSAQLQQVEAQYQQQLTKVRALMEAYQRERQALEQTQKNSNHQ